MINLEKNINKSELSVEKKYVNNNIECIYENLPNFRIKTIKKIIDNISPFLDHKILVNFKNLAPHNPGFHSSLNPEFKTPEDFDKIYINSDFFDKSQIEYYFLHELGHAFEHQLDSTAKHNNLDILPENTDIESDYFKDYSYGEFQADFIAGFILNPDYVKNNLKSSVLKNTYEAVDKMFEGNNFIEIRKVIESEISKYKIEAENQYKLGKIEKPAWLDDEYEKAPIYLRAFDKKVNTNYQNYFNILEEKFK